MNEIEKFTKRLNDLRPKIVRFIKKKVRSSTEAEDLAQETIYKVLKYRYLYSGRGSFEGWVYRIANNLIADMYRLRNLEATPIEDLASEIRADESVYREVERHSMIQCLHKEIENLSNNDRQVISLKYLSGLSHKQIALQLGCSIEAAKMALSRARKRFRGQLEQVCEFCHTDENEFICQPRSRDFNDN